ncbi:CBS domain-containing protein [Dongia sedimenti]|uniref:CBS domain-containing protein n=1 Tax=Dongia sedimenti TaxID=3064282 RepID=A0ABU0YJE1_9PROT|nr:CBS domain-containing protein [Rhodospirillaceae bacterium R-7]
MRADEIMTSPVVTVTPDTPASRIAKLLLENHVSAVPVVDASGAPLGIVSEGDLLRRDESGRAARRAWWLEMLAEGEPLSQEYLSQLRTKDQPAKEIMSAPVVTVTEASDVAELAHLFSSYRIKRVPVLRDGRVVGIVSRVDLLRSFDKEEGGEGESRPSLLHPLDALISLEERLKRVRRSDAAVGAPAAPAQASADTFDVAHFQALALDSKHEEDLRRAELRRAEAAARRRTVEQLIDHHVGDETWRNMLHKAREAAQHGQKEFMLLRFPHDLCSDGGRAINVPEPEWPKTLRGEAAEVYLRWERELKERGFRLAARVLDFPGGFPGDIGLFLVWGQ